MGGFFSNCCWCDSTDKDAVQNELEIDITRKRDLKEDEARSQFLQSVDHQQGYDVTEIMPLQPHNKHNRVNITIDFDAMLETLMDIRYSANCLHLEQTILRTRHVSDIVRSRQQWRIYGTNTKSLNSLRHSFKIVYWRIPVIRAFHHEIDDKSKLIARLRRLNHELQNSLSDRELADDIWDVLNSEKYIEIFGMESYSKLNVIRSDAYHYYFDADKSKHKHSHKSTKNKLQRSQQYLSSTMNLSDPQTQLVTKLQKIAPFQKFEIVLIGQRRRVCVLLKLIRECEVIHPSFKSVVDQTSVRRLSGTNVSSVMQRLNAEKSDFYGAFENDTKFANKYFQSYVCTITNIVEYIGEQSLHSIFMERTDCNRILSIEIFDEMPRLLALEHNHHNHTHNNNNYHGRGNDNVADDDTARLKFAKIHFDNEEDVLIFIDTMERGFVIEGEYVEIVGENPFFAEHKSIRHTRALFDKQMLF